jgi:hypothetical protein
MWNGFIKQYGIEEIADSMLDVDGLHISNSDNSQVA